MGLCVCVAIKTPEFSVGSVTVSKGGVYGYLVRWTSCSLPGVTRPHSGSGGSCGPKGERNENMNYSPDEAGGSGQLPMLLRGAWTFQREQLIKEAK